MEEKIENSDFKLKAVAEFLDGKHHFSITSYQRGYRWDKKQVEDLLKDIWDFTKDKHNKETFYCLQPIVVKQHKNKPEIWDVIDGQQRLTTMWLILKYIKENSSSIEDNATIFVKKSILYDIKYETKYELNLSNPDFTKNLDSFYVFMAKMIIKEWFEKLIINHKSDYSTFAQVLFNTEHQTRQVKFIWSVVENQTNLDSLKVFNNLNKGKIKLTNAELIKALFVLNSSKHISNTQALLLEWNMMENELHNESFWLFLANRNYAPSTRIDLLFDFVTEKKKYHDNDYSYRKFQSLYDGDSDNFWAKKNIISFDEAWKRVKVLYQVFLFWYENRELYHYIGYLLSIGCLHQDIYQRIAHLPKNKMIEETKKMIKEKLKLSKDKIDTLLYDNKSKIREVLLLFNIESCIKSDTYRFPFDIYKTESWDIEHVASQTDNKMQATKDKIEWLSYIEALESEDPDWGTLKEDALELLKTLKETKEDKDKEFENIYRRIVNLMEKESDDDTSRDEYKNFIGNLTLLDSGTNRSYGNALFQTKRQRIIENDKNGLFVPPCTRNLFLKYYTSDNTSSSVWKNKWTQNDAEAYKESIKELLKEFLN